MPDDSLDESICVVKAKEGARKELLGIDRNARRDRLYKLIDGNHESTHSHQVLSTNSQDLCCV